MRKVVGRVAPKQHVERLRRRLGDLDDLQDGLEFHHLRAVERISLVVEGMCVKAAVQRLQLPLHLADPGRERVDELAAQKGGRLFRRFPRLPFVLAQLVGFDIRDELLHPRLHLP
ncbi:hypothetical protein [Bradyrhizobium arachidis]|uniref:hypothetical protein n=1 Tax=Bradyrhizobium arachidis TaxID=858423 RepID=UPI002162BD15|nr:hypothetical protein [Bradyrhizobium arachidis]